MCSFQIRSRLLTIFKICLTGLTRRGLIQFFFAHLIMLLLLHRICHLSRHILSLIWVCPLQWRSSYHPYTLAYQLYLCFFDMNFHAHARAFFLNAFYHQPYRWYTFSVTAAMSSANLRLFVFQLNVFLDAPYLDVWRSNRGSGGSHVISIWKLDERSAYARAHCCSKMAEWHRSANVNR